MVNSEHGQDLAGFSSKVDYTSRNQFVSFVLANPDWETTQFTGGSGFDNPLVNTEFAVVWAEATQPNTPLSPDKVAQIREIGGSDEWIEHAGLGSDTSNELQAQYLMGALDQGWTSETFGESDDITLNDTINLWLARPHANQFNDEQRAAELQALASGETEAYVLAVLGDSLPTDDLGSVHPAIQGRLGSTIDEINNQRADGARINAIPVFLNTGGAQVQTFLFQTTNKDGEKVYIDMAGEHFSSVDDWHSDSRLPPGNVVITGNNPTGKIDDVEFVSPLASDDYSRISFTTEAYVDTAWEHAEPWVVGGVTIIGAGLFFVAPPVGGTILAGTGAYQAGKGIHGLIEIHQHGGEFDWSDPRFRGDVMNLAEGSLQVVTAGGGAVAIRGAQASRSVSPWLLNGLKAANAVEGVYSVGAGTYQVTQIINSDLPPGEKAKQLAQMGFMLTAQGLAPIAIGHGLNKIPGRQNRPHTNANQPNTPTRRLQQ